MIRLLTGEMHSRNKTFFSNDWSELLRSELKECDRQQKIKLFSISPQNCLKPVVPYFCVLYDPLK